MKRRDFGLLAGTSLTTAVMLRPNRVQAAIPDPSLLTTTLTPLGSERAGNADGSIPAWTGGLTSSTPIPPNQTVNVPIFTNEQPLYTVDASNMAQYADLLTPGTQAQITQFGLKLKVYPTHRTAAAPQYVYDNIAKNVTRAQLDPRGGRFGFTGAYGGVPFPIIDTENPLNGGAQLIWNHLTAWGGASSTSLFTPGCVVIGGKVIIVAGTLTKTNYLYYDPNGSLESYQGYFSKGHYWYKAPSSVDGEEVVIWHSTNVNIHPDIVWSLLQGQGRVRKAPNESFDTPSPAANGIANIDESSCFYGNPSQYDWTYITKKEMLVPYNNNAFGFMDAEVVLGPHFPDTDVIRWEKHRVWVVEANLHPGQRNVNVKRRFYIDEDTYLSLLGEGYDAYGAMAKCYVVYNQCIPSLPGTIEQGEATFSLLTGEYAYNGNLTVGSYKAGMLIGPLNPSDFDPQQMAASASF